MNRDTLLVGYYGQQNTGDDAFLSVAAWGARKYLGAKKIWATTSKVPNTHGTVVRPLYLPWQFRGCGILNHLRQSRLLPRIQHVIFGGGSNFHSTGDIEKFIQIVEAAGNGPHFAIGVSVGPFRDPHAETAFVKLCSLLSFVGLRDRVSLERVRNIAPMVRAELTFDLAPLLPLASGISTAPQGNRRKGLGISICNYERFVSGNIANEQRRIEVLAEAISSAALRKHLDEVVLLDFNGHPIKGDSEIHEMLTAKIQKYVSIRKVFYSDDPVKMYKEINGLRGVVAMRLHAAVFAFCGQTPTLMLAYHEKCNEWARMIGLANEMVLETEHLNANQLIAGLSRIYEQKCQPGALTVKSAIDASMRNWTWCLL